MSKRYAERLKNERWFVEITDDETLKKFQEFMEGKPTNPDSIWRNKDIKGFKISFDTALWFKKENLPGYTLFHFVAGKGWTIWNEGVRRHINSAKRDFKAGGEIPFKNNVIHYTSQFRIKNE